MRNEAEAWRYIIRRRKKRKEMENNIGLREWRSYFKSLLEGENEYEEGR